MNFFNLIAVAVEEQFISLGIHKSQYAEIFKKKRLNQLLFEEDPCKICKMLC